MAKVTLPRITSGYAAVELLNSAFEAIEAGFENTLSRDGTSPNQMTADLDVNGQALLNTADSNDPDHVVSLQEMQDYVAGAASGIVVQRQEAQVATAGQTSFTLVDLEYVPDTFNLAVYVNGVRQFAPFDYLELSTTSVQFSTPLALNDVVLFVTNEYLSTVSLTSHTHPWSQITNVPVYTTRWPTYAEVTGKPATFAPSAHTHPASDITSGRLADARRGVYVQASTPTVSTVGELWFW